MNPKPKPNDPWSIVREFERVITAAYKQEEDGVVDLEQLSEDWLDLVDVYECAVEGLKWYERAKHGSEDPVQIKKWISTGEFGRDAPDNFSDLLEQAGNLLDHACSREIVGEAVFVAEDDTTYVMTVEAMISEINPDYLKDILAGQAEGGPENDTEA